LKKKTYIRKEAHKINEPGSIMRLMLPTFEHDAVIIFWARFRGLQSLIVWFIDGFENLLTCESGPRLETIAEHFP
jgi:hypothetical protein